MSVVLLVIDGLGVYNKDKLSTFQNLERELRINPCEEFPTLWEWGLNKAYSGTGNIMMQRSYGVGSLEGHREMLGHISLENYAILSKGIHDTILDTLARKYSIQCVGNIQGRGKNIIPYYWDRHLSDKKIIIYSGLDSTVSIAYEKSLFNKENIVCFSKDLLWLLKCNGIYLRKVIIRQYVDNWCNMAEEHELFHSIDFNGTVGALFDNIFVNEKIDSIFNFNISTNYATTNDDDVFEVLFSNFSSQQRTLYFFNLGDFDYYAHKGESEQCFIALRKVDKNIAYIDKMLGKKDALIIVSDHGIRFCKSDLSSAHVKEGTLFLAQFAGKRYTAPGIFEGHNLVIKALEAISKLQKI